MPDINAYGPNHVALVQEMAQPSALMRGPLHVRL